MKTSGERKRPIEQSYVSVTNNGGFKVTQRLADRRIQPYPPADKFPTHAMSQIIVHQETQNG